MHVLFYEVTLALRRLWRRPGQAGLMLAIFTISITLTLLSWSLFHTMFLQHPEYDPHGTLHLIAQSGGAMAKDRKITSSREDIAAWQEQQTVFSEFAPLRLYESVFVHTENGQERLLSANVSAAAFQMVNARPLMGRLFLPEEDALGSAPVVILGERTWRNRFAAAPDILGQLIKVDGVPATVIGVMPAAFRFPNDQDIWQSLGFVAFEKTPQYNIHDVVARLKPGISTGRAAEDLRIITERRGSETMAAKFELRPVVTPLRNHYLLPEMHQSATVLFALALVFVLVGCANAANLVMIDFFGRTSEIASTLALGIPRAAAIRTLGFQLLSTAGIAAGIGYILLLIFAPYVHGAMARIVTPYWLLFTPQWHHLAMAAALAIVSAGVAIIVPLVYLFVTSPERIIGDAAGSSRGTGRGLGRSAMIVGQLALLTVLAVSAGLLLRSNYQLRENQWGFDARNIFVSKTAMKEADFPTPEARLATHLRLLDEINRLPGVAASAMMTNPVGFSGEPGAFYALSPEDLADGRSQGGAIMSAVTPDIFAVFDTPFFEGETFSPDQQPDEPPYIIINHSLAMKLWPGESAVGRTLFARGPNPQQPPRPGIVRGVVRDFQAAGPKTKNNDFIYYSIRGGMAPASFLYARGRQSAPNPEDIRRVASLVDPRMAIYFPNTLQGVIDTELSSLHLTTRLTVAYTLAAIFLCGIGVYSITVSQILQRHREFGIRLALGIEPDRLWMRFAARHLIDAGLGVAIGLTTAVAVVHVLQSLLFGVNGRDPFTYCITGLIILFVSAMACLPSRVRLQRINPADCLRSI